MLYMSSDSQPVERQADAPRGAVLCVAGGVDVEALSDAELADRLEVLAAIIFTPKRASRGRQGWDLLLRAQRGNSIAITIVSRPSLSLRGT